MGSLRTTATCSTLRTSGSEGVVRAAGRARRTIGGLSRSLVGIWALLWMDLWMDGFPFGVG